MSRVEDYREALAPLADPEPYLLAHSGLPGPRGNIELARAAAGVCPADDLRRWEDLDALRAPTGTAEEFLAFCGVLGIGPRLRAGDAAARARLRRHAGDSRWRVREAVAMAVQVWAETDFDTAAREMAAWADGTPLERRAAAAALCEPALLTDRRRVAATLAIVETATDAITSTPPAARRTPEYRALRTGMGYCWSVAVAANPDAALPALERRISEALTGGDRDLRWVVRENLRKRRLQRAAPGWAAAQTERLAAE